MKTYLKFVSQTDESELKAFYDAMSEEKKESVDKLNNTKTAKQRIVADGVLRKALFETEGIPPEEIVLKYNESGKPYAENSDVKFSVSHSKDAVICAVSDNEIGVDIEKIRDVRFKVAERFATEEEIAYIGGNTERFFEIWTLKEAYFKCIGTGLDASIKNVSFKINGKEAECSEKGFKCSVISVADGYCCSICEKLSDAGF